MDLLRRFSFIAALALATGLAHAAATPDCDMKTIASVDVDIDANGAVLVPVQADGHDAWMVLRMAGGLPTIYPPSVAFLDLKPVGVYNMKFMVDDVRVDKKVNVGHILIGKADFKGWDMYVLPERGGGGRLPMYRGKPVIGNLTSMFMQVVDVELNLAAKKMNLFTSTHCHGKALYWGGEFTAVPLYTDRSGVIAFPMEVDGKAVETSFATGSRYSLIDSAVTKKFFGFDEKSDGIEKETLRDGRQVGYHPMSLWAKGLAVNNTRIQLFEGKGKECSVSSAKRVKTGSHVHETRDSGAIGYTDCFNITPFAIGTDLLQKLRVYIATKEQMVYFTRADAPAPPAAAGGADPAGGQ